MPIQNLEQVRAKHALQFAHDVAEGKLKATGREGGDAMKKIPPMIMANGLLAAIAFAIEERKNGLVRPGHAAIFDAIAAHLASPEIRITKDTGATNMLLNYLSNENSDTLKLATEEALAWLGYARRFLTGGESSEADDKS